MDIYPASGVERRWSWLLICLAVEGVHILGKGIMIFNNELWEERLTGPDYMIGGQVSITLAIAKSGGTKHRHNVISLLWLLQQLLNPLNFQYLIIFVASYTD